MVDFFHRHDIYPFGEYVDKILGYANQTFATLYHTTYKKHWHNGTFYAKMTQNYTTTDWQNATFETYIPTQDATHGLSYYRIAIKILPEIDNQTFHQEAEALRTPLHMPPGELNSEFQVIISPKLKKWGFIRSYRHRRDKKGYISNIYITKTLDKKTGKSLTIPPEVVWIKILRAISTFLDKRLHAFLEALNLHPWQTDHKDNNTLYYICCNSAIVSRFSHSIRTSLSVMSEVLDRLLHKIWAIKEDIGNQSIAKHAIKPLLDLSPEKLADVFVYIRQELKDNLQKSAPKLNAQELRILKAVYHG